jgi:hypothetical protein
LVYVCAAAGAKVEAGLRGRVEGAVHGVVENEESRGAELAGDVRIEVYQRLESS